MAAVRSKNEGLFNEDCMVRGRSERQIPPLRYGMTTKKDSGLRPLGKPLIRETI